MAGLVLEKAIPTIPAFHRFQAVRSDREKVVVAHDESDAVVAQGPLIGHGADAGLGQALQIPVDHAQAVGGEAADLLADDGGGDRLRVVDGNAGRPEQVPHESLQPARGHPRLDLGLCCHAGQAGGATAPRGRYLGGEGAPVEEGHEVVGHVIGAPQPLRVAELVVRMDHAAEHDEALPVAADGDGPVHEGTVGEEQHRAAAGGDLVEELGVRVVGDVALQVVEGDVDAVAAREDAGASRPRDRRL